MGQETAPRVLDATKATRYFFDTCTKLDAMVAGGFFQIRDVLTKDALDAWADEKAIRTMEARAAAQETVALLKRREVLKKLSTDERLALGYPQLLPGNPDTPIFHVAEKERRKRDATT
jgi:hypothetical protein